MTHNHPVVSFQPLLGATIDPEGTTFRVWAPQARLVELLVLDDASSPAGAPPRSSAMHNRDGYHSLQLPHIGAGTRYAFRLDGKGPFPDPASRWQPEGVHGPSAVIDWASFQWTDHQWTGVPLTRTVIYELHVGTFTPEGTFAAAAARLPWLADLGVTAVELMPVADFPGDRNWGYDGVAPFAPSRVYGSPDDFRRLVDAAHQAGLAVFLDVVYNHLGPDGAYQATFNPFFYSQAHRNPWGSGINFDGPQSGPVREYFIENALRWVHEFHIDGLRLDATHAIIDDSDLHILAELKEQVQTSIAGTSRLVHVIAEDSRNLDTLLRPRDAKGWGLDAVWADDLHHHLRRALAGDADGYFEDFDGSTEHIADTARRGWFFTGQFSPHAHKPRGTDPAGIPLYRCVICLQNHDQVGNRAFGERLHHQIAPEAWRAASALLLALPETPLLFMGQEWAASAPFLYFTDHGQELGRLVTEGRRQEFARFLEFSAPANRERIPDPQARGTFLRSRLDWSEHDREPHASALRLYRRLLALRRSSPALAHDDAGGFAIEAAGPDALIVRRGGPDTMMLVVVRLRGAGLVQLDAAVAHPPAGQIWQPELSTDEAPFAADPRPPELHDGLTGITFARPGAVIFTSRPGPADTAVSAPDLRR